MAKNDLELRIRAIAQDEASKALRNIEKQAGKVTKEVSKTSKAFKALKFPAQAFGRGLGAARKGLGSLADSVFSLQGALAALGGAFVVGEAIDAAARQEQAVNSVAVAIKRTGEFSEEALQGIQDFASSLQDVTGVGDETTLEMISLAKSFGATNEQAQDLTVAAIELAAATGKSTDEAIRQVSKTLGGFAGELGEVNPAIKELTKEQLQAGEAARILIDQYGGTAQANLSTFAGAVSATRGRFGDFLETIGDLIIKNPVVISLIGKLGEGFKSLGNFITNNSGQIGTFISKGLKGIVSIIPSVLTGFRGVLKVVEVLIRSFFTARETILNFYQSILEIAPIRAAVNSITSVFIDLSDKILSVVKSLAQSGLAKTFLNGVGIDADNVADTLEGMRISLNRTQEDFKDDTIQNSLREAAKEAKETNKNIGEFFENIEEGVQTATASVEKFSEKLNEVPNVQPPKLAVVVEEDPQNKKKRQTAEKKEVANFSETLQGKVANSLLSGIQKGAEGASQAVASITGQIIDLFAPGFGAIVSQAIGFLAQGADAVREQVTAFADAIPDVILALAEAAPVLIETLADKSPEIIQKLVEKSPDIIAALVEKMPEIALALAKALSIDLAVALVTGLTRALEQTFGAVFSKEKLFEIINTTFNKVFGGFADAITRFVRGIEEFVNSVSSGFGVSDIGGGGQGLIPDKIPVLGALAKGGQVPPGFPNDSFPARLTSGELVVPPGDTQRLSQFLDNQQSGNQMEMLARILNAVNSPMQVTATAQVNEEAFADIILNLNRNNARLA